MFMFFYWSGYHAGISPGANCHWSQRHPDRLLHDPADVMKGFYHEDASAPFEMSAASHGGWSTDISCQSNDKRKKRKAAEKLTRWSRCTWIVVCLGFLGEFFEKTHSIIGKIAKRYFTKWSWKMGRQKMPFWKGFRSKSIFLVFLIRKGKQTERHTSVWCPFEGTLGSSLCWHFQPITWRFRQSTFLPLCPLGGLRSGNIGSKPPNSHCLNMVISSRWWSTTDLFCCCPLRIAELTPNLTCAHIFLRWAVLKQKAIRLNSSDKWWLKHIERLLCLFALRQMLQELYNLRCILHLLMGRLSWVAQHSQEYF